MLLLVPTDDGNNVLGEDAAIHIYQSECGVMQDLAADRHQLH